MVSVDHKPEIGTCERISLLSTAYICTKPNGLGFDLNLYWCGIIFSMPWHLTCGPHPRPHSIHQNVGSLGMK